MSEQIRLLIIIEMLYIKELKSTSKTQTDNKSVKLFV